MSTSAMKYVDLVKGGVVKEAATVSTGRNNVINVHGITGNGTLKFEVSVDGGTTYVEDETLETTADGPIVLENAPAIIRAKIDDVVNASTLLVQLGY